MAISRCLLLSCLIFGSAYAVAGELIIQSGPTQTVMIELFTSEGCSSCPPAERFLAGLVDDARLWHSYIPLAFHVDYWDYLGWRDRYASAANTRRQREYGRVLQARTIYTPEFFVNGREWRRGMFGGLPPVTQKRVGNLKAVLRGTQLTVDFDGEPARAHSLLQLHVALLGMGLESHIAAGENAGRRLRHQFVVLGRKQLHSETPHWETELPPASVQADGRKALVFWINAGTDPRPLQAAGGFLP